MGRDAFPVGTVACQSISDRDHGLALRTIPDGLALRSVPDRFALRALPISQISDRFSIRGALLAVTLALFTLARALQLGRRRIHRAGAV
jgi:hypothetical protein